MKFLGRMKDGIKAGFNWVKKHKVLTFLLGMGAVGVTAGVMGGMGFGGAALMGLGAAGVGALAFGAPFLLGGLAILAVMGIAGLFGAGGKKKEPEPRPPAVSPADPSPIAPIGGLDDCPPNTGLISTLPGDTTRDGTDAARRDRANAARTRGQVHDLDLTASQRAPLARRQGPGNLGLSSVLAEDEAIAPTLIEDAPDAGITPTEITDSPALAPVGPSVNLPLGEPVG